MFHQPAAGLHQPLFQAGQRPRIHSLRQRQPPPHIPLIDLVTTTFDEKVQGGKFWARLATCGLDKVHVTHELVHANERLLTGGVWANVELLYDDSLIADGAIRPFVLHRFAPIQIASANLDEFIEARRQFTRQEWIDVIMRSLGYEPKYAIFSTSSSAISSFVRAARGQRCPDVKTGGRLINYWLLLAEGHLTRRAFGAVPPRGPRRCRYRRRS